ncbi:unnamed protein product [Ectocarpus sp. 13 AM-2016]
MPCSLSLSLSLSNVCCACVCWVLVWCLVLFLVYRSFDVGAVDGSKTNYSRLIKRRFGSLFPRSVFLCWFCGCRVRSGFCAGKPMGAVH